MAKGLELVHVEMKRDTWLSPERMVFSSDDAVKVVRELIENLDRELVVCVNLATSGRVINASICSVGTMDTALISPPEIMRCAILSGASRFIMLHNHPSGLASPSKEDALVTKRLATVSNLFGIDMLDSIIIGDKGSSFSFKRDAPEALEPAPVYLSGNAAAESQIKYEAEGEKEDNKVTIPENYVTQNRQSVVEKMIEMIKTGQLFYSPQWSRSAMRPRNPISGARYRGGNRLILMQEAVYRNYKDPRWMTFKQLSSKGYHVKAGEHGVRLEKWSFTKKVKKEDPDGNPIKDADGHFVYEDVLLQSPKCRLFYVFNGEQIQDLPKYEQKELLEGEIGNRIEAMLQSSDCAINEVAQDRSFYRPSTDEIFLPLRTAFHSQEKFAAVAAHEMVHSTGHPKRLNREYGRRDIFGYPDDKYCIEELKAELGSVFFMADAGIPMEPTELEGAAAYLESYIKVLKENPNVLFKIASDADKASNYLYERFEKIYQIEKEEELIEDNPNLREKAEVVAQDVLPDAGYFL